MNSWLVLLFPPLICFFFYLWGFLALNNRNFAFHKSSLFLSACVFYIWWRFFFNVKSQTIPTEQTQAISSVYKSQLLVIFQRNWFRFSKNTFHRLLGNKTIPIFLIWSDTNFARNIFQNCYQMVESCQVSIRTLRKHVKTFRYEYTN